MPNRLAKESSPYLLQHAHNPVDWYPWGPEAFETARKLDRPIFLSVGYSTCYWCHVMERQSFEDAAIAEQMNRLFVNVKVDREERPDVDQLYMTALQIVARHGGWPMSIFLMPDLRPFYAGTYFPPRDSHGRPGFSRIMDAIDDAYRNRREEVARSAEQIVSIVRQMAEPPKPREALKFDEKWISEMARRNSADFDSEYGGFGTAPKFPRETLLEFLLLYLRDHDDPDLQQKIRKTLDAMVNGGIRDHLGGGFHRYSTDAQWLVPHFEIMLYDNAMLAWIYAEAYRQWNKPEDAAVARGICDFVLRELTSPSRTFYTALDAEVDAHEGEPYLWTRAEVMEALKEKFNEKQSAKFCRVYGLEDGPNFSDPHAGNGHPDKNVLFLAHPQGAILDEELAKMRQTLYEVRKERKQPRLDDKILPSWNGLMIRAFAFAGEVLDENLYVEAAKQASAQMLSNAKLSFLDDYAFLAQAHLELKDRESAARLAVEMKSRFYDESNGGFYFTAAGTDDLIVRQKIGSDSPLPSGNGVAATVMLELGESEIARETIAAFAGQIDSIGEGMSALVTATMRAIRAGGEIIIGGSESEEATADRLLSPEEVAKSVVTIEIEKSDDLNLLVRCKIMRGFHVAAPGGPGGVHLSVDQPDAKIEYPAGKSAEFEFGGAPKSIYENEFAIAVQLAAPAERVEVSLFYQACDSRACLPIVKKTHWK